MKKSTREAIDSKLQHWVDRIVSAPTDEGATAPYLHAQGAVEVLEVAGLIDFSEAEFWRSRLAAALVNRA